MAPEPKSWASWSEALADHATITFQWPAMYAAYLGPNALAPDEIEAVMLTVNSVNSCSFCTGLHGELGRISGIEKPYELDMASSVSQCVALCKNPAAHAPAVKYARVFAAQDGRGAEHASAFAALAAATTSGHAGSVRALCWFMYWGSVTGNTINAALGKQKPRTGAA